LSSTYIDFPIPLGFRILLFVLGNFSTPFFPYFEQYPLWYLGSFTVMSLINYGVGRLMLSSRKTGEDEQEESSAGPKAQ
jgi:hypothetical protein